MNILVIANSFGEDSTKFLYDMAKEEMPNLQVVNLYIGGCCLERHWDNVLSHAPLYDYQLNGKSRGKLVAVNDVIKEREWDIITLQQCSGFSGKEESYEPYFGKLVQWITDCQPKAKMMIHQTWAYSIDSNHEHYSFYNNDQDRMYQQMLSCYEKMSATYNMPMIPFGELIQTLRSDRYFDEEKTGTSFCRDGFHMHLLYGRYALAAMWYVGVLKGRLSTNGFVPNSTEVALEDDFFHEVKRALIEILEGPHA